MIFKNCASFTNFITEINNAKVDDAQDINLVMPMYNLIEYSDNYSKTSRSLWEYYNDEPPLDNNGSIIDFPGDNNNSISCIFKLQTVGQAGNGGTKDIEIMVPLKYLSNLWRTLEMPLVIVKLVFS